MVFRLAIDVSLLKSKAGMRKSADFDQKPPILIKTMDFDKKTMDFNWKLQFSIENHRFEVKCVWNLI